MYKIHGVHGILISLHTHVRARAHTHILLQHHSMFVFSGCDIMSIELLATWSLALLARSMICKWPGWLGDMEFNSKCIP